MHCFYTCLVNQIQGPQNHFVLFCIMLWQCSDNFPFNYIIFLNSQQQAKEKETEENIKFFKEVFDRNNTELLELTEEKHKETERRGEELIRELDEEIAELKRRQTELEKLSHHMDFTQVSLSQQTMVRNEATCTLGLRAFSPLL